MEDLFHPMVKSEEPLKRVERVGRVLCPIQDGCGCKAWKLLHFDYQKKSFSSSHNRLGVGMAKVRGLDTDLTFDGARLSNRRIIYVVDSKLRIYYAGTHHRSDPVQTSLLSRKRKELSSAIYSAGTTAST
jgi:hypothetical protein